jgi:arabinofuranosyltransferase
MENVLKQFRSLWLRHGYITAWLALGCIALSILLNAWVAEDAYITFRVVDNFLNGYGLRWNVHERVQVYTHPLWMLLHIPLAAATWNIYLASIGLCLACSYAALIVVMRSVPRPPLITIATFIIPLYFSKAFMDYTSSGLENPLSFLMFAVFGHVLMNHAANPRFWLYVSLTVAIALFNRLDVAVIYACLLYTSPSPRDH